MVQLYGTRSEEEQVLPGEKTSIGKKSAMAIIVVENIGTLVIGDINDPIFSIRTLFIKDGILV